MQQRKKANTALSFHKWKCQWVKPAPVRVTSLLPVAQVEDNAKVDSITGVLRVHGVLTKSAYRLEKTSACWAVGQGDNGMARLAQVCLAQLSLRANYE